MTTPTDATDGSAATGDRESNATGTTAERRLRLRALFAEYGVLLLVGFVLVAALGGWLTYGAYADSGTETEQRLEHRWTATGSFSHGATVHESTAVYDAGTVLENEPLYYTSVTPTVDGEFVGGYDADAGENVSVDIAVDVRYRAVDPEEDLVYWSERERLAAASEDGVAPGESVAAPFSLNVSAIDARIAEIESDLGTSPGETEIALEVRREIEGTVDGEHRTASDRFRIPVTHDGATYRIETADTYDEQYETYETVTVAGDDPDPPLAGLGLLALGLAGTIAAAVAAVRVPEPTAAEREWLAYRDDRAQFEEVIASIALPESELEGERASVDTLADLAEFGIDVDEPIVFDRRTGRYVVRREGVVYVFEPPTLEGETGTKAADDGTKSDAEFVFDRTQTDGENDASSPDPTAAGESGLWDGIAARLYSVLGLERDGSPTVDGDAELESAPESTPGSTTGGEGEREPATASAASATDRAAEQPDRDSSGGDGGET
ncbi:DUF5305 domain-containing protein [Halopiger xanaduensis]|uniref:DUF5305 domain-containing protein n=1 Tax=Halopiger xanaduensis (strain DSM 18323 / JCM 14033 / SH-6) TaxID=797210 RepID=F8DA87_HALXS|nr:DUF5305 domain-containing protein [Halopiger xanaduensis]AEH38159.1 Protein of unknown function DUF2133 [Halopiger xanaduensis SH-6]